MANIIMGIIITLFLSIALSTACHNDIVANYYCYKLENNLVACNGIAYKLEAIIYDD